jgi:hypothetical protein
MIKADLDVLKYSKKKECSQILEKELEFLLSDLQSMSKVAALLAGGCSVPPIVLKSGSVVMSRSPRAHIVLCTFFPCVCVDLWRVCLPHHLDRFSNVPCGDSEGVLRPFACFIHALVTEAWVVDLRVRGAVVQAYQYMTLLSTRSFFVLCLFDPSADSSVFAGMHALV